MKTFKELVEERIKTILTRQQENGDKYHRFSEEEIKKRIEEDLHYIPERYKDAELTDEKISEQVGRALKERGGCYFYGPAGTGKTYLLYAIMRRLGVQGYGGEVWNLPDILAGFRMEYGEKGEGEGGIDSEIKTKSILLIDDFGAEKQTEWNTEIMYRIINFRYENMLPTFFASNLSLQELAERSGDRFASRIAEMCDIIKIDGQDRRIKNGRKNPQ